MSQGSSIIAGIDLGTTNSAIAIYDESGVRIFENSLGEKLTPSVVAYDERADVLRVGRMARDIMALNPTHAAGSFKCGMGEDRLYSIATESLGPTELSALVLGALRQDAERQLGHPVQRCVVTVPAYFSEDQRIATRRAAEIAGFTVERILNEPTAAAISYGLHNRDRNSRFLVFDLGGGTFDVCIMELFEGALEVCSAAGEINLGGENFTTRLMEFALLQVGLTLSWAQEVDPIALGLFRKRVELAKRELSHKLQIEIKVPAFGDALPEPRAVTLTSEETGRIFEPLLERLLAPCRQALRGARMGVSELEEVILVGGATRMPCVRAFVEDLFGQEPLGIIDPDLAVVQGAAIQAALCSDGLAVEELVVTDVASHSLGVEIVKKFGSRFASGYFSPVIHRNTVIPVSRSEIYATVESNQTSLDIEIFEGESRRISENRHIGALNITGIPRGPAGRQVEVRFTYDLNGILEVEAHILGTEKRFNRIFTRNHRELSEQELREARMRVQSLKTDPREKPHFRDLLLRADLLVQELPDEERNFVEFLLDRFESALETHNPGEMEQAYRELLEICERYDGGLRW